MEVNPVCEKIRLACLEPRTIREVATMVGADLKQVRYTVSNMVVRGVLINATPGKRNALFRATSTVSANPFQTSDFERAWFGERARSRDTLELLAGAASSYRSVVHVTP